MKAAVHHRYGSPDVVTIDEMPEPVPRADEVLIRVHAAPVGIVDSLARRRTPAYARLHFGLRRPRFAVLGSDFAGQVEAAGPSPGSPSVTRSSVPSRHASARTPSTSACPNRAPWHLTGQPGLPGSGRARRWDRAVLPAGQANLQRGQTIVINNDRPPIKVLACAVPGPRTRAAALQA
jgi:threonine dehydrogenase-like Zn-dependent dehydrogenase